MKTRVLFLFVAAVLAFISASRPALAQFAPKTANLVYDLGSDGSLTLAMEMTFDAAAWRQWKSQVGDEPSRLRAMMKHQFSAYVVDDFKLEKDDLNRTAKVTIRSPAGPELRKDGRFRIAIEKEFRLVNNTNREWFFSGNNPYANNSLQTIRLVLPPNAHGVTLNAAGSADQGLIYSLNVPSGRARIYVFLGGGLALAGALALIAGFVLKKAPAPAVAAGAAT